MKADFQIAQIDGFILHVFIIKYWISSIVDGETHCMLQSHWHSLGCSQGCPHLASVMGTPSGQYVQLTLTVSCF